MVLDYSNIRVDQFGRPEVPELILQTLSGKVLGVLGDVSELKFHIKFSEPSEISFDIPRSNNGVPNELYGSIVGHRVIYTKDYGVYVIKNPEEEDDGIMSVKHVTGYSLEQTLDNKTFFLEEGTYNFWNPVAKNDTILGRILEIATDWTVGYVSPSLIGRYRTFSEYDDYLLPFVYNTIPDKYRCVFSFNPYEMTFDVYDADEEREILPIFLDFGNLLESTSVEELSDELVTALRPYGADTLDIGAVNPIGTNWLYDISYFIDQGDIDSGLAKKWEAWQHEILNNQAYYNGLIGLQASANAKILAAQAELTDLKGELTDLTNQQSVTIQALAMETTEAGISYQQELLDQLSRQIESKKSEIAAKEAEILNYGGGQGADGLSEYAERINTLVKTLAFTNYFSESERAILSRYFIEQDFTDDTFVATDLNAAVTGSTYAFSNGAISIQGSSVVEIDLSSEYNKTMYTIKGGQFSVSGDLAISGDVIRGTIEIASFGKMVMSLYAGTLRANDVSAPSGMITLTGSVSGLVTDVKNVNDRGVVTREGSSVQFNIGGASLYLTANINDYQKYSVQMELFEHAAGVLSDLAIPTYEFSVDSANFLFAQEFEAFRDELELGCGVYLRLNDDTLITPLMIELELDFDSRSSINLIFSNRFKRHDSVNTLKDLIDKSYSSSRNFDASKYIYNQASNQMTSVTKFMNDSLDAAVNSIMTAPEQKVVIDGAGIHVGDASGDQIRIINNMIAMTEDGWKTAKLAIGRFKSPDIGEYWGINAEVIGGKLIVGNNLVIENVNDAGIMQFLVDSSGVWLYNATFVIQNSTGSIMISPEYGVAAGNSSLFTTEGTTVYPGFIDSDGDVIKDSDGMPQNANFYLDSRNGSAYFRGTMDATSGNIGGWTLADNYLYSGSGSSYVALSSSGNSNVAIWAGGTNALSAPFRVMRNGDLYANSGNFKGTVYGINLKYNDDSMMADGKFKVDYLTLKGLTITNGSTTTFSVDSNGNVSISGKVKMGAGSVISWSDIDESGSAAYKAANSAEGVASNANTKADEAKATAEQALNAANNAEAGATNAAINAASNLVQLLADGQYGNATFISGKEIFSPTISAGTLNGGTVNGATFNAFSDSPNTGYFLYNSSSSNALLCSIYGGGSYNSSDAALFIRTHSFYDYGNVYTALKMEAAGNISITPGVPNANVGLTTPDPGYFTFIYNANIKDGPVHQYGWCFASDGIYHNGMLYAGGSGGGTAVFG